MNRFEYVASMNFLTKKKNEELLPYNTREQNFKLEFTKKFSHKTGVRFEESFKGNNLILKIECIGTPNKKDLVLFGKLEELIFEFLDKQEVRCD
jgi:hypothetical protein